MAKQYRVNVLEEDFENGIRRDSNHCAVKEAVERSIPGAKRVEVDLQTIRFSIDGERHVFLTPWQVSEYVIAFDAGDDEGLHPFAFVLRPSQQVGSKVRREAFTESGQEVDRARNRVRKAKAKRAQALEMTASEDATPSEKAHAEATLATIDEEIEQREQDYKQVRAEAKASGKPQRRTVDADAPKPPRLAKGSDAKVRDAAVPRQPGRRPSALRLDLASPETTRIRRPASAGRLAFRSRPAAARGASSPAPSTPQP